MPDMVIPVPPGVAVRVANALAVVPDKDGMVPPTTASNAEKWAHAHRVAAQLVRQSVRGAEMMKPDPDLDGLGER
jgi:hypothetical protein